MNRLLLLVWLLLGLLLLFSGELHLWSQRHVRVALDIVEAPAERWQLSVVPYSWRRELPDDQDREGWFDPRWQMSVVGAEPSWIIGDHIYSERNLMGRRM